jgi:hypothetical protein
MESSAEDPPEQPSSDSNRILPGVLNSLFLRKHIRDFDFEVLTRISLPYLSEFSNHSLFLLSRISQMMPCRHHED